MARSRHAVRGGSRGRRIQKSPPSGLSEQTPEAVLAARIDASFMVLTKSGYVVDAWVIRTTYKKRRWRMLVEYLEFMEINEFPSDVIDFIRNYRPEHAAQREGYGF